MLAETFTRLVGADPLPVAAGIFAVLLLSGFGLPLPEDVTLAFTGYACHLGVLPLWLGIALGLSGVMLGDSSLWWIGHRFGEHLLDTRLFRFILSAKRLAQIRRLYQRRGSRMLFMARFMPGLRSGVFLFAGWSGVSYGQFIRTDGLAALISVPALVCVTYAFGSEIDRAFAAVKDVEYWIFGGIIAYVLFHFVYTRIRDARNGAGNGNP